MIDSDDAETPLPNLQELCFYFEQAGVGLGREETFRVWLALKALVEKYPLESIRFWGKIFGIEQNYYVAEVKFQDGKDEEEEAESEEHEEENKEDDEENEVFFLIKNFDNQKFLKKNIISTLELKGRRSCSKS